MVTRLLIGLLILSIFDSCSSDKRLDIYNQIINKADKIKIYCQFNNDFKLTKEINDVKGLEILKEILKRDIKPETPRKIIVDKKFEIIKDNKVVGQLMINDSKNGFVNFMTNDLVFGFRLTYGIGMY